MKHNSQSTPWHAADVDGLYMVRDNKGKEIFYHVTEGNRELKASRVLLVAAAPELLLSLCEMVFLAEPLTKKGFESLPVDFKIACDRAKKIISKTNI